MLPVLTALAAGIIFGMGLAVSQMVNPAKVLGFLDVTGRWDPSLALVMAGALSVTALSFRLPSRLPRPLLSESFRLPHRRDLDARLVTGAVIFGIGWGLVGLCPGPALAALPIAGGSGLVFAVSLLAGTLAGRHLTGSGSDTPGARTRPLPGGER